MFSIIMPVWNRAGLVKNAIESVLAQTFQDYELLIIDDGSKDNLEEVVRPYLNEKVIYHRIPHSGLSAARNFGLRNAGKPFIAYLDSDNSWHPEYLATMYEALQGTDVQYHAAYCQANRYVKDPSTGKIYFDRTIGEPFSFRKLMAGNYIDINMFVHSRNVFKHVGFFDEKLKRLKDWDYIIRTTSLFEPVFVPKTLVDYYFGVADNVLSLTEDLKRADTIVRKKHSGFNEPVKFVHDIIQYTWKELPEEKYYNWVRIHHEQLNTSDYTAWGLPWVVQLEPTNVCNMGCPLCPVTRKELGRKPRHMTLEEFKNIINEMEWHLLFLVLWDWGEPFTNPDLPEMIRYAWERGIKTVTSTNAQFLDNDAYLEAILTSGLSTLIVAIDSALDENYQFYRRKGSFSKAISGLQKVVEMKKRFGSETLINMRMVIMRHNEHELRSLCKLARQTGVDLFSVKAVTPGYGEHSMDREFVPKKLKYRFYEYKKGTYERIRVRNACRRPSETTTILSNGDVVPCCWDCDDSMKVGNVFEKPFREIWTGPAYRELRKKIFHDSQSLPKCRWCPPNFQLSRGGWFPVWVNFRDSMMGQFKTRLELYLRQSPAWEILKTVRGRFLQVRSFFD